MNLMEIGLSAQAAQVAANKSKYERETALHFIHTADMGDIVELLNAMVDRVSYIRGLAPELEDVRDIYRAELEGGEHEAF